MQYKKITELNTKDKIVFIRTDLNVPMQNGVITDNTRIIAGLTTIKYVLNQGGKVIVATHLGRPNEGQCTTKDSVQPIAAELSCLLNRPVLLIADLTKPIDFTNQDLVILENVRCNIGEKTNDANLGRQYADLCDIFVNDAFATAHRVEASTYAIAKYAKKVCAGILMAHELEALNKVVTNPRHPVVAIIGGAKVSTKLNILNNLADKVDLLIVGGGILNTFLLACGYKVGKSLAEPNFVNEANLILGKMRAKNAKLPLPTKVVVANELSPTAKSTIKNLADIDEDDIILDVSEDFAKEIAAQLMQAGSVIWNGPLGVFEFDQFASGTKIIAAAIANSPAYSVAGGGDTIAAINKFKVANGITYISTGGGALLEFLEGKTLPAIRMLEQGEIYMP